MLEARHGNRSSTGLLWVKTDAFTLSTLDSDVVSFQLKIGSAFVHGLIPKTRALDEVFVNVVMSAFLRRTVSRTSSMRLHFNANV